MKPYRSEKYRRYVAAQPCFRCGIEGLSQCAHANGGGMGTKASDADTFPLCCTRPGVLGCHAEFDQCIGMTKATRRELTEQYVARMRRMADAAGWVLP
jgi:hypothetical protein